MHRAGVQGDGARWNRRIGLVVLALAAGLAAALALRPSALPVETAAARRGAIKEVVEGAGRARVRERYELAAPVPGALLRPALREGEPVKAGQVVATVVPAAPVPLDARSRAELSARVAAAEAGEAEARAGLERARLAEAQATADLARAEALAAGGSLAAADAEAARYARAARGEELRMAESARRRAEGERAAARAALGGAEAGGRGERVVLRSPVDGVLLRLLRESAGPLAAGTPVAEVGDPTALEIELDLLTTQAVRVRPGAAVEIVGWGGPTPLPGRVRRVDPSAFTKVSALGVEEQRVHVVVDPAGDPLAWSRLGDGYAVEGRVVVAERRDALTAPAMALFRSGSRWAVFAVEDGRARLRLIDVAEQGDGEVAVTAGLAEGARLVLHPSDKLADGVRVVAR